MATKGGGWNPKSFEEVVSRLEESSMSITLGVKGTRTCPAPKWDPGRAYRVTLVDDKPVIQRFRDGQWEAAPLEYRVEMTPAPPAKPEAKPRTTETRLFISHSSKDVDLAKELTALIDSVLTVPKEWMRCTSVSGFKLEPGADGPDELRANLNDSIVVVGVLTQSSLASSYVLMELGAAWGFEAWVIPFLAPDVEFKGIPGPIGQGIHAAKMADPGDVAAVLDSIEKRCGMACRVDTQRKFALVSDFVAFASKYVAGATSPLSPTAGARAGPPVELAVTFKKDRITQDVHDYTLLVKVTNVSKRRIDDWLLEFDFPTPLGNGVINGARVDNKSDSERSVFRVDGAKLKKPLLPGDSYTYPLGYRMTHDIYTKRRDLYGRVVKAHVLIDGSVAVEVERPFRELQDF